MTNFTQRSDYRNLFNYELRSDHLAGGADWARCNMRLTEPSTAFHTSTDAKLITKNSTETRPGVRHWSAIDSIITHHARIAPWRPELSNSLTITSKWNSVVKSLGQDKDTLPMTERRHGEK
jgi:hypothetical protein